MKIFMPFSVLCLALAIGCSSSAPADTNASDAANAVTNSMDNAANAVDNAANKVGEAAGNAANKVGEAAGDAANKVENAASNAAPGPTSEPKPYTNDKGELLCPVMGTVVESKEKAVGFQDVDGTRYYFCCAGCPEPFKKDPAKYTKK